MSIISQQKKPFTVEVQSKKASEAVWLQDLGLVEITKMRGNFWRIMGFNINNKSFLYSEEALYLLESAQLVIKKDSLIVPSSQFYEILIRDHIPLSCYLTYVKLKSLDYIVLRHKKSITSISKESDIPGILLRKSSGLSYFDALVSYDIFFNNTNFTKRKVLDGSIKPAAYVIVTTSETTFSAALTLRLLEEAVGIPIIFAACMSTGYVIMEEFTDATRSINLSNIVLLPNQELLS